MFNKNDFQRNNDKIKNNFQTCCLNWSYQKVLGMRIKIKY